MQIAWNIAPFMHSSGLDNAFQLAEATGLSYPACRRIVKGGPVAQVNTASLARLARYFKVEPFALLSVELPARRGARAR